MSRHTSMAENAKLRNVPRPIGSRPSSGPPFAHHQHGGGAVGDGVALAAVTEP